MPSIATQPYPVQPHGEALFLHKLLLHPFGRVSSHDRSLFLFRRTAETITAPKAGLRFKHSPFLAQDHNLTDITSPSEVRNTQDRGTGFAAFNLSAEERATITAGTHQVRLYCTSGQFWSTALSALQTQTCPIEFPPVVEVRVNNTAIQNANTRGLKKKPGTAPPVDLTKLCRVGSNRVDFTYINNSSPFAPKVSFHLISFAFTNDPAAALPFRDTILSCVMYATRASLSL